MWNAHSLILASEAPGWVDGVAALPWRRFTELPWGTWIALGALLFCLLLGGLVAFDGLLGLVMQPAPQPRKGGKKGFRLKYVALLLLALLPGGLVGTAAVTLIMGKKDWRQDAATIVEWSIAPGALLAGSLALGWPWNEKNWFIPAQDVLGLAFGLMQLWALIKLLREAWGEPESKVPWWPPMALWFQATLAAAVLWLVLR